MYKHIVQPSSVTVNSLVARGSSYLGFRRSHFNLLVDFSIIRILIRRFENRQEIPRWRQLVVLKQVFRKVRHHDYGDQRTDHGEGFVRKQLTISIAVVRVLDQSREVEKPFTPCESKEQANNVTRKRTVYVAVTYVHHTNQLREQHDVDEVPAQVEQHVDGFDREGQGTSQEAGDNNSNAHDPHQFSRGGLGRDGNVYISYCSRNQII